MTEATLVTMFSAGAHYGVPVMAVRDVLNTPTIYPVPLAPREIAGGAEEDEGDAGTVIIDTHDADVPEGVWTLYEQALKLIPCRNIMIERDDHIPALPALIAELEHAKTIAAKLDYARAS